MQTTNCHSVADIFFLRKLADTVAVVAIITLAQARARHAWLEALAVVFLTFRSTTITAFEMVLALGGAYLALAALRHQLSPSFLGLLPNCFDNFAGAEGVRVAH